MGREASNTIMKTLTVAFITARSSPKLDWFLDSFKNQTTEQIAALIVVDNQLSAKETLSYKCDSFIQKTHTRPKPTVWQGEHRLTKEDWWATSNARNTAICLCQTDWIAFLDDRCVLLPGYLDGIKAAMKGNYAVCGAYEKRHSMTVENGAIVNPGITEQIKRNSVVTGIDSRERELAEKKIATPYPCSGGWYFGCNFALPLEWALQVGGVPEVADSLGMEDVLFGLLLENNKFPIKYDPRMKIIEDRTPAESGPVMRRVDKGKSPHDKSHALLAMFTNATSSLNIFNIRALRNSVLRGEPFPIPSKPTLDWWDKQPISEFK